MKLALLCFSCLLSAQNAVPVVSAANPVQEGQPSIGAVCAIPSPFYANLNTGALTSCQNPIGGYGAWTAISGAGSTPPAAVAASWAMSATSVTINHNFNNTRHADFFVGSDGSPVNPASVTVGLNSDVATFPGGAFVGGTAVAVAGIANASIQYTAGVVTATLTHNFQSTTHGDQCIGTDGSVQTPTSFILGTGSDTITFTAGALIGGTCTAVR